MRRLLYLENKCYFFPGVFFLFLIDIKWQDNKNHGKKVVFENYTSFF